jgi:hypothetical protein
MAAKRRRSTLKSTHTKTGPRGPRGRTGPPGTPGDGAVARLAAQVEMVVKELQTQLRRIAQIQMQIDRMVRGHDPESRADIEREDN